MNEQLAWDIYFSTIMGMQFHPGYNRENATPLTVEQAAKLATEMILERRKVCH